MIFINFMSLSGSRSTFIAFLPLPTSFLLPKWAWVLSLSLSLRSEDANPLGETLHICILSTLLIIRGQRRRRRHKMSRVRQSMFPGKHLPAAVITLMGNVTSTEFSLQLPQVQPCLVVLKKNVNKQRDKVSETLKAKLNGILCNQSTSKHFLQECVCVPVRTWMTLHCFELNLN